MEEGEMLRKPHPFILIYTWTPLQANEDVYAHNMINMEYLSLIAPMNGEGLQEALR